MSSGVSVSASVSDSPRTTGPALRLSTSDDNKDTPAAASSKKSTPLKNGSGPLNWIQQLVNSLLSPSDSKSKNGNKPKRGSSSSTPATSTTIVAPPSPSAEAIASSLVTQVNTPSSSTTNTETSLPPLNSIPIQESSSSAKKTLILDLDETLVHSTIKPVSNHHMTVDVLLEGVHCTFYVIKRPHVDAFLKQVAEWYDVTIFTASMRQYADPLLDQLDPRKAIIKHRLFRESCLYKDGSFIKDLGLIGQDLTSTIIVDNSPIAYSHNRENALPIDNWLGDNPKDESLLNLLPFLDALRFTQDVRSILSLRVT